MRTSVGWCSTQIYLNDRSMNLNCGYLNRIFLLITSFLFNMNNSSRFILFWSRSTSRDLQTSRIIKHLICLVCTKSRLIIPFVISSMSRMAFHSIIGKASNLMALWKAATAWGIRTEMSEPCIMRLKMTAASRPWLGPSYREVFTTRRFGIVSLRRLTYMLNLWKFFIKLLNS